jgi:hypothetical protein
MRRTPTTLDDVHRTLGASLLALAERGELKAGDGSRLVAEAKERAAQARMIEARKELAAVMRKSAMTVHAAGCVSGEASDIWVTVTIAELQRITDLAMSAGLHPSGGGTDARRT